MAKEQAECPTCGRVSKWVRWPTVGWKAARCLRPDCRDEHERRIQERMAEIRAGKRSPVEPTLSTVCIACGDTHSVKNDPDTRSEEQRKGADGTWLALIPCPICPMPCRACTSKSGYCRSTPCSCSCHVTGRARAIKAAPVKERKPKPMPPLETNEKRFSSLPDRIDMMLHVLELSNTYAWRWEPLDMVIFGAVVRQDGSAEIEVGCPTLAVRAKANGQQSGPWTIDVEANASATQHYGSCPARLQAAVSLTTQHMRLLLDGQAPADSELAEQIEKDTARLGVTDVTREWRSGILRDAAE